MIAEYCGLVDEVNNSADLKIRFLSQTSCSLQIFNPDKNTTFISNEQNILNFNLTYDTNIWGRSLEAYVPYFGQFKEQVGLFEFTGFRLSPNYLF